MRPAFIKKRRFHYTTNHNLLCLGAAHDPIHFISQPQARVIFIKIVLGAKRCQLSFYHSPLYPWFFIARSINDSQNGRKKKKNQNLNNEIFLAHVIIQLGLSHLHTHQVSRAFCLLQQPSLGLLVFRYVNKSLRKPYIICLLLQEEERGRRERGGGRGV